MQDRKLPDEVLQLIFKIAIEDDSSLSFVLPLVSKYFLNIANEAIKNLLRQYFGPFTSLSQPSIIQSYPSFFYKLHAQEDERLNRIKDLLGVSLGCWDVLDEAMQLPCSLEFFIISAVSARAYEELHMLVEQIRLNCDRRISVRRIIDAIFVQASMNYNGIEFLRLRSFIPVDVNDLIGKVVIDNHQRCYNYFTLIEHAVHFGNRKLVVALVELGACWDDSLFEFLKERLTILRDHHHWQEIHDYLLQRISPQTNPPDCPGPL